MEHVTTYIRPSLPLEKKRENMGGSSIFRLKRGTHGDRVLCANDLPHGKTRLLPHPSVIRVPIFSLITKCTL